MKREHSIDVVMVLLLLCVFAVSVMMVLMSGASAYGNVADHMKENYQTRTGTAYVTEKVRHCGENGSAELVRFPTGEEALSIGQDIEGERYCTYIYYYDGYMRELFTNEGNFLDPETGTTVLAMKGLELEQTGEALLKVTCVQDDGSTQSALICTDRNGGDPDEQR